MAIKSLPIALATLVLAGSLLTACGTAPAPTASAQLDSLAMAQGKTTKKAIAGKAAAGQKAAIKPTTKMLTPPVVKLPAKKAAPAKKAGSKSVLFANYAVESEATNDLYRYNDLRNQWLASYDNNTKASIEQEMLNELVSSVQNLQSMAYGDYQIQGMATNGLQQYQQLDYQWAATPDDNQKEYIVNEMLNVLTQTVQSIQQVAAE